MLDIFANNAFGTVSLTDHINNLKYRASRINGMGLFMPQSVNTDKISLEYLGDTIQLVKPSPRGGAGETKTDSKRSIFALQIPHFQREWSVNADEVMGVRAFGSESDLETVQGLVSQRLANHLPDFDLTEEHARLGAITGIVTYADNSTLNLYTQLGVTANTPIAFALTAAATNNGVLREKCENLIREVKAKLGGVPFQRVHAFVGDEYWKQLIRNPEVRDTYKNQMEASWLRSSSIGQNLASNPMFEFGGITFENYGDIGGAGIGIAPTEAQFFPVGVNGLFKTYYAPADYMDTVNTMGKRIYAKQWPRENDKGILGEIQMNALQVCTRPTALFKGTA